MAASLVEMAAGASREWEGARGVAAQAAALRARLVPLAQADAEAYATVVTALERSADHPDERRDFALGRALDRAAQLPLAIAEAAADVTELSAHVAGSCSGRVRGEVLAAGVLSEAVVRAAVALVEINLATAAGDERLEEAQAVATAAAAARRRVEEAA
jgi:formiminotetrahydrofolate cyclodeaminase